MKKLFAVLLSLALIISIAPLSATTARAATSGGSCGKNVTWVLDTATGVLKISGSGEMESYSTPNDVPWYSKKASVKTVVIGHGVTSISRCAFSDCANLTSITIPDGVTSIGECAFDACSSLRSVVIPDSVTSIGECAFTDCRNLTNLTIGNGVTVIGSFAFFGCNNLTNLTLGNRVTTIGSYAFFECRSLISINLPNNKISVGEFAFYGCSGLSSLTIPNSETSIGEYAFYACSSLKDVWVYGSKTDVQNLEIGSGNDCFTSATWHYDTCKNNTHTYKTIRTEKATTETDGYILEKCSGCGHEKKTITFFKASSIQLSTTSYTYSGGVKTPSVTVKTSKGETLKKDVDYSVKYASGRKSVGKYAVTVTLKGNYSGTKTLSFTIYPAAPGKISVSQSTGSMKASWSKVSGVSGYKVYLYKGSKCVSSKTVSYKTTSYTFRKLSSGTTYTVKVKAYKTVSGTNYWSGTKSLETATRPKTPSITYLKSGSKSAKIKWSNVSGESGYQVYCATKRNGTYKKAITLKSNDIDTTIKSLTKGKTYYFKVRAYKKTASGTVYSSYSSVRSVKVK